MLLSPPFPALEDDRLGGRTLKGGATLYKNSLIAA